MRSTCKGLLAATWLCLLSNSVNSQELPTADDYAYAFPLSLTGKTEFFELNVPPDIYQSVSDPLLRDAGVYNADGQPVPRIFEHPLSRETYLEQQVKLGAVPLYEDEPEHPDQLRLVLQQAPARITLQLEAAAAQVELARPLKAYIVDARNLEHDISALELSWPQQPQGFIGRVQVEHSDDLQQWRRLGSASIANLEYEDTSIIQNRVELNGKASDYLRISWRNMPESWSIDAITGFYTLKGRPAERDSMTLDSVNATETNREFVFDAGGYPPVDRINLALAGENVVVRAGIYSRKNEQDRWRLVHRGLFYNITRQGETLRSSPARIDVSRAGLWRVRLESGITNEPVQLRLAWQPDRLAFVAQGPQPFEIVAGRARDRLQNFPQEKILGDHSIFGLLRESGKAGVATVGTREARAGSDRLEVAPTKSSRVVFLWAGLIAAVLLVAWMAYSLMRDMRKDAQ